MPIVSQIRSDLHLIISIHIGMVPDEEFLQFYNELYSGGQTDLSYDRLVDLRRTDSSVRSSDALRALAHILEQQYAGTNLNPKTAVIAPQALSFGLGRMYESFASSVPGEFVIFRAVDAALAWLGAPSDVLSDGST